MRKLIVAEFITLDGVIQAPGDSKEDTDAGFVHGGWTHPYWHDEIGNHFFQAMNESDALLLGRITWQGHGSAFDPMPDGDPFGDVMKSKKKYVVSTTWKFNKQLNLPIEYWDIETGGSRGGLLQRPAKTPPPEHGTNAFVCSLEVENFDQIAGKIMKGGGQVALEKFPVPGRCWQGYFIDTEGNTFGIFQVDEKAG